MLERHLGADDPVRPYADRLREPGLGDQSLRGYLSGSIDVVIRAPGPRYVVVDYKTNWLGEGEAGLTAADYAADRLREAMLHSDYPLQALLYTVVLHRYLRWRQPGYDPEVHLGGVLYLYVRGMCGPETPTVDGHPAGVFSWHPPAGLVTELSDPARREEDRMTAVDDPCDVRIAMSATGLLRDLNLAGVLDAVDLHVADRVTTLARDDDPLVALAVAVAVRAVRGGSVCVRLDDLVAADDDVAWPDPVSWRAAIAASPLTREPEVLHLESDRLYLDRYWREEVQVCADMLARTRGGDVERTPGLDRVFPLEGYDEQRDAAALALAQPTTVLTGGPGTGKTTAVAGLLALLAEQAEQRGEPPLRIALSAPTGKAAARLQQAVEKEVGNLRDEADRARLQGLRAMTLHRLLGTRPDTSARFRHHRDNRLPHDVVVVDEASMVSLTMMARLLEALRHDARLVLVGDPDQLASVEAGAVLADLVDGLGARRDVRVAALATSHRFGEAIGALAAAVRDGRADDAVALLRAGDPHVVFEETDDPAPVLREVLLPRARELRLAGLGGAAEEALALLDGHRLLCAHRDGPYGVHHWNHQVERWLSEELKEGLWSAWYPGRPFLVTANDYGLGIFNGDTGVAVLSRGVLRAVVAGVAGPLDLATSRVSDVETMHAMTIHKSQGSQAQEVTVLLPDVDSRLLTRELLYTAITRAQGRIRLVGSEASVRAAIDRPVGRASGLRRAAARGWLRRVPRPVRRHLVATRPG